MLFTTIWPSLTPREARRLTVAQLMRYTAAADEWLDARRQAAGQGGGGGGDRW